MTEEALSDTIDQDLVKWALLRQKNGKAVGPDGIACGGDQKSSMLNLFSKSLLCLSKESLYSHTSFGTMELLPQYHTRPFVQF